MSLEGQKKIQNWQADCFANFVLEKMGILPIIQLNEKWFEF